MASEGPLSPGTLANNGAGTLWVNPGNAAASDDSRSTAAFVGIGGVSAGLRATNFGFAAPSGQILGVVAEVEGNYTGAGNLTGTIQLVKGGALVGSAKALNLTGVEGYVSAGGAADLWGATLTLADVLASTFGCEFVVTSDGTNDVNVDHVRLTVYYSEIFDGYFAPGSVFAGAALVVQAKKHVGVVSY